MRMNIVGLRELRENMERYIAQIQKGRSFTVVRKSKPLFKISSVEDESETWETVVNFTKVRKGGISAEELLKYL